MSYISLVKTPNKNAFFLVPLCSCGKNKKAGLISPAYFFKIILSLFFSERIFPSAL